MKAIQINQYGDNDVLQMVEIPIPTPKSNQVLVQLKASSVNPVDYKIRSGYLSFQLQKSFPFTLGWEGAGIITDKGVEIENFSVGDEVIVMPNFMQGGTYAEMVAVNQEEVLPKPKNLNFNQAATLPFSLGTAYAALIEDAQIKEGQRILILGAGGAVGKMATQIAKMKNLYVVGTAKGEAINDLKNLGIDTVIDYSTNDFSEEVKDFDVILDLVGGDFLSKSYPLVKQDGILISTTQPPDESKLKQNGINGKMTFTANTGDNFEQIRKWVENEKIHFPEVQIFSLDDAQKALSLVENREAKSKVIFEF